MRKRDVSVGGEYLTKYCGRLERVRIQRPCERMGWWAFVTDTNERILVFERELSPIEDPRTHVNDYNFPEDQCLRAFRDVCKSATGAADPGSYWLTAQPEKAS